MNNVVKTGIICTKYKSLEVFLNELKVYDNPYTIFENTRVHGWINLLPSVKEGANGSILQTDINIFIRNLLDAYDLNYNAYYKFFTSNVPGKNLQFSYNDIFLIVLDKDDYYGYIIAPANFGSRTALFLIIGINMFKFTTDKNELDYYLLGKYHILTSLLPQRKLNSLNIYSYFTCLDVLLPIALCIPPDFDNNNTEDMLLYNTLIGATNLYLEHRLEGYHPSFIEAITYLSEIAYRDLSLFDNAKIDFNMVMNLLSESRKI